MAANTCSLVSFVLFLTLISNLHLGAFAAQYNVVASGARPDSNTDSTRAFIRAWVNACASTSPATIYVPKGRFLIGNVELKGPCKNAAIVVQIDGTLVAPSYLNAYNWVIFSDVNGVTISGGTLDGQGTALWACKASGKGCQEGATSLEFTNSNNIVIGGLTSFNRKMFHIVINGCDNVKLQGVNVSAPGNSPNTDGIHVQRSTDVTISKARIATGDDCVSIGPGTKNLWIEHVACGPGHGISIGSLGKELQEAGVQNVTITSAQFSGTQNGVRIKSWGRPSHGFARNISFQHCNMTNVRNPIVIDQNYCPHEEGCPGQASGVQISNVIYQDIHGSSTTEVAVNLDCSDKYPCRGIGMENVKLTYMNKPAEASCIIAVETISDVVQPACRGV